MQKPNLPDDPRRRKLEAWLARDAGLSGASIEPASADASFRRYFRVFAGDKTLIAMDAPPGREDCRPFVAIAGFLESMGLNAPRVVDADLGQGFLLLTDLGERQYLSALEEDPASAGALYRDALAALATMQQRGAALQAKLPPYDEALLRFELSLFSDWYCGRHLGIEFDAGEAEAWQATTELLVRNALDQPQVFVHRDYHSRNLMVTDDDNPGILDFQDAVEGPLTYDLVSLLKDAYIEWPAGRIDEWVDGYYALLGEELRERVDPPLFRRYFELMGVQRHLKVAGIFARLNYRDGKARYLADIPRVLGYVTAVAPRYDELGFIRELIAGRCSGGPEGAA